jgi:large subunit ribosomal protein L9
MQVILKKDIPQLGRIGELIKVREGYARNYLIPRSFAVPANGANLKNFEHQKRLVEVHKKKVQKESLASAEKFKGLSIKLERRFNEAGKMYGAVTSTDIAAELAKKEFVVDRRDVELEMIKAPGEYVVKVRLPGDVFAEITLALVAMKEKAAKEDGKKPRAPRTKKTKSTAKESAAKESDSDTET